MAEVTEIRELTLPFSEVCMFMGIAGQTMSASLTPSGRAVQLFDENDRPFSGPITLGEAGWGIVGADHTVTFWVNGRWFRK